MITNKYTLLFLGCHFSEYFLKKAPKVSTLHTTFAPH